MYPQTLLAQDLAEQKKLLALNSEQLFQEEAFKQYQTARGMWQLSEVAIKIAYLFEHYFTATQVYEFNKKYFFQLMDLTRQLLKECDVSTVILTPSRPIEWPFGKFSILMVAMYSVNKALAKISNPEYSFCLIELIKDIHCAAPRVLSTLTLDVPANYWETVVNNNDIETIKIIIRLISEQKRHELFKYALFLLNIPMVDLILEFEASIFSSGQRYWLERIGLWPFNIVSAGDALSAPNPEPALIRAFVEAVVDSFPLHALASDFNLLFPFSNERYYDEVLELLTILNKLKQHQLLAANYLDTKIRVGLLFGESHFLSMLPSLVDQIDVLIMADVEPRQHKHIQHLLSCIKTANSPDEFTETYFANNPILNERIGDPCLDIYATEQYLGRNLKKDNTGQFHFLVDQERFLECKQAAEKITIFNINLNLTQVHQCKRLADLLAAFNARFALCNFTNIHNYDARGDIRSAVAALLINSSNCLTMFSTGPEDKLSTNLSYGITPYLSFLDRYHNATKLPTHNVTFFDRAVGTLPPNAEIAGYDYIP